MPPLSSRCSATDYAGSTVSQRIQPVCLGASGPQVVRQVILPLMLPVLMSAMVLIFAKCLGECGVASVTSGILGLQVGYVVVRTPLRRLSLFAVVRSRR